MSPSHTPLEPLTLAIMATAFGMSRALLPFVYLRRTDRTDQNHLLHWLPLISHFVHHGTSMGGAVLFPTLLLKLKCSAAFLPNLAKSVCLLCLAIFQYLLANGLAKDIPMPFPLVPPFLALFVVGVVDGLQQRMLLTEVIDAQRDATVAQQRYKLFTLLLLTSLGPFCSSLLIQTDSPSNVILPARCFGICPLSADFGISLPTILVFLSLLQALLLPSLWLSKDAKNITPDGDADQCDEYGGTIQYMPSVTNCPQIWHIMYPLCALCTFSSALFNNFGTVLFSGVPSSNIAMFSLERENFVVFSSSALITRLALALCQYSAISKSKMANLLHTNALFSVGLLGAGLAFCTLNVANLRTVAVALFGGSLSLFWPIILAQWCNFYDSLTVKNATNDTQHPSSSILGLLISADFGTFLFPILFTQLLAVYDSPRLFNTVALFLIIAMVVSFVWLLNVQAEYKTAKRGQFWGFWRGGRTRRSIRRLMRSVRTSLRRTPATGRNRQRLRPRMGTGSALLDENSWGTTSRMSNYQSVVQQQGCPTDQYGEQRPRTNTAHEIILINDNGNEQEQRAIGEAHKKQRHISLPDIVLDVGTPKNSVCVWNGSAYNNR